MNNPLAYTDQNGKFIWFVVAAVVGGTINWVAHASQCNMMGLAVFGIGAAAGVIGMATGGSRFWPQEWFCIRKIRRVWNDPTASVRHLM